MQLLVSDYASALSSGGRVGNRGRFGRLTLTMWRPSALGQDLESFINSSHGSALCLPPFNCRGTYEIQVSSGNPDPSPREWVPTTAEQRDSGGGTQAGTTRLLPGHSSVEGERHKSVPQLNPSELFPGGNTLYYFIIYLPIRGLCL